MRVALDLSSSKLGWAMLRNGASDPEWGLLRMPPSPNNVGPAAEALRQHLADLHALEAIQSLFFEAQFIGTQINRNTLEKLLGLAAIADWFAHRIGANVWKVEVSAWRKHFFLTKPHGDRTELKRLGVVAAHARNWMVASDDEADALGILDFGLHCVGFKPPWAERHLFAGRLAR